MPTQLKVAPALLVQPGALADPGKGTDVPKGIPGRSICNADGCDRIVHARGLCERHERQAAIPAGSVLSGVCVQCGKPFEYVKKTLPRTLCSPACWTRRKREWSRQSELAKRATRVPIVASGVCAVCGGTFEFTVGYGKRPTICSLTCKRQRMDEYRRAWQTRNPEKARQSAQDSVRRRRSIRRGATNQERYTYAEIFDRDSWRCQLCGKKVNRKSKDARSDPKAPVIDHIIPLALGGDDVRANVQCAHMLCNSKKRIRTGPKGDQLRLIG